VIFESPQWLFALLALPLVLGAEAWLTGRDRDRLARLVARPLWGRVVRRPDERWRWVRLTLVLLGVAGVVVALARPLLDRGEKVKALRLAEAALAAQPANRDALQLRLEILTQLRQASGNLNESGWLNFGIKQTQRQLDQLAATP